MAVSDSNRCGTVPEFHRIPAFLFINVDQVYHATASVQAVKNTPYIDDGTKYLSSERPMVELEKFVLATRHIDNMSRNKTTFIDGQTHSETNILCHRRYV